MSVSANADTTFISGTPTTLGAVNFTVSGVAQAPGKGDPGAYGKKSYTINVVGIATASPLPDGDIHKPYSVALDASSIPGALSWSQTGMPTWLNFNNVTGALYGQPTVVENDSFTMTVTNGTVTCSKNFTLSVKDPAGVFWNIVWGAPSIALAFGGLGSAQGVGNGGSANSSVPAYVSNANTAVIGISGNMTISPTSPILGFVSAGVGGSVGGGTNLATITVDINGTVVFQRQNFGTNVGTGSFTVPAGVGKIVHVHIGCYSASGYGDATAKNCSGTFFINQV
jgi:hypothetical protein